MSAKNNITKDYYKKSAKEYIDKTIHADLHSFCDLFASYLKPNAKILDLGCGSGRDSLYLNSKGFDVYSMDNVEEFVEHVKNIGLPHPILLDVREMSYKDKFDGIYACASLLHLDLEALNRAFKQCHRALKPSGVMYVSFKYGKFEGIRDGRFYIDLDTDTLKSIAKSSNFEIIKIIISDDIMGREGTIWINAILRSC